MFSSKTDRLDVFFSDPVSLHKELIQSEGLKPFLYQVAERRSHLTDVRKEVELHSVDQYSF